MPHTFKITISSIKNVNKLKGKVALVTGGNSGVRLAAAKELIAKGATVIITGRNQEALESTANEIGATALVIGPIKPFRH